MCSSDLPMVGPFRGVSYSFGALRKTFGPLRTRCDCCRRYARLFVRKLRDVDYQTKTSEPADGPICASARTCALLSSSPSRLIED